MYGVRLLPKCRDTNVVAHPFAGLISLGLSDANVPTELLLFVSDT